MDKEEENNETRVAEMLVEDFTFVIPEYINTNINCISRPKFSETEKLKPQVVKSYFSEYSSIHFFTEITSKQIIFETYNESGTPKPNLIFYVDTIDQDGYQRIFDFFEKEKTFEDLTFTHNSQQHIMIKDNAKNELGEMWQGDNR
ncbi:MAG: hypothetical protein AAF502_21605 [Bacteroidota bacterium]